MKQTSIPEQELNAKLESFELCWAKEGLPLRLRPLESFQEIYGSVLDEEGRKELFDPITMWYVRRYGYEAMEWDGVLARIPVLLRGLPYLVQIPFVAETTMMPLIERFEKLPKAIAESFTLEEFDRLSREVGGATISWKAILELGCDSMFLGKQNRALLRRAMFDLEAACGVLTQSGDTQRAVFDAHAAAEKFLKIAFRLTGTSREVKDFSHKVSKLFEELACLAPRYAWLNKSVGLLQQLVPNMMLRYETSSISIQEAIMAIHASLFVCGCLATMWNFDNLRGSRSSRFRAGKFYKNGSRARFYCKKVTGEDVVLTFFEQNRWTGGQLADIKMSASNGPLYLEIVDPKEEASFIQQLTYQLKNPGRQVKPEEIGLKITDSPEGIYTTAIIRRKVSRR